MSFLRVLYTIWTKVGSLLFQARYQRLSVLKEKKMVAKISSAERGETMTIVCAMSAAGNFVPPALIFPRKRMKAELMDGAPPQSIGMISDSGYMNTSLFLDWLKHFEAHVRADADHPVLLIMDNHSSHRSLEAILFCRENNIHLLTIPPHSSHRIQPLDRCYFKALKTFYATECDRWLTNNPGRNITHFQIARILGRAYERCSTMDRGIKGFESCGIYPINENVFTDEDFLPSSVTERNVQNPQINNSESESDSETSVPLSVLRNNLKKKSTPQKQLIRSSPVASTSRAAVESPMDALYFSPPASTVSQKNNLVSPEEIIPLPRRSEDQKRRKRGQKSEILSSTPFKEKLEAERAEKLRKEILQANKATKRHITNKKNKNDGKNLKLSSSISHSCPACSEKYSDPPTEDWIQCQQCQEWWHEKCTAYESIGSFICDICE